MARPNDSDSTIFHAARALPPEERATYLDRACRGDAAQRGRVESLLRHDAETGLMATGEARTAAEGVSHATLPLPDLRPEERIGHFTIRQTLGEGGFGVVYQAEQTEPVRRMVALKVIKPGMDSRAVIARFEAERQALAVMDHPCVAKVFDGGLSEQGRPWFAMELVKGLSITEHCDRHRLSLADRLELFIRVCEAVQHAHAKGVIHRDLKPSNILVEYEGGVSTPKVIDFGVAKALNQRLTEATIFTEQGQLIGTPEYMSPEQAEMGAQDIDIRSDVYSLGVILYELLTGARPFESASLRAAGLAEIQRIIRETDPPKPSTRLASMISHSDDPSTATRIAQDRRTELRSLSGTLRRDLDWVVMKCLEKDRGRRYDTANALVMELRRYLDNEPVLAGPPSAGYRAGKFVKRNRAGVLAASAGLVLLLGGLAGTSYGLIEARRQEAIASQAAEAEAQQRALAESAEADAIARADELQLVANFQSEQLGAIDVEAMGVQLREAIIEASPEEARAPIAEALAGINFTSIALGTLEANFFERTIGAIGTQFESQPLVRAQLLHATAAILGKLGLLNLAIDPQERALKIRRDLLGNVHPNTLISVNNMGFLLQSQGKLDEAEQYYLEALEGNRRVMGDGHRETLNSVNSMGFLLQSQGKLDEAEPYFREALETSRRVLGKDDPDTLVSVNNMGFLLSAQGQFDEAESYYREALDGRRRVLGDDHPSTLTSVNNLGNLLESQGRFDEAEPYYREALEASRRVLGDNHSQTMFSLNNIGNLLESQDRLDEAEPYYREALEVRRRVLGDDHPSTLTSVNNLGNLLNSQGRLDEAEPYFREALQASRRVLGDNHPHTLISVHNMGFLLEGQGRLDEAEQYYREAVEGCRRVLGDNHPNTLIIISNMGSLLQSQGKHQEAIDLLTPIEPSIREASQGGNARSLASFLTTLSRARADLGYDPERFALAEANLLEAHPILVQTRGEAHEVTLESVQVLVDLYTAWDAAEPGKGYDAKAGEWRAVLDAAQGGEGSAQ